MNLNLVFEAWPPLNPQHIQLYSLNTPNGIKVALALEELGLPYEPHLIDIMKGDQFTPAYKELSPNSKIPTILDPNGPGGQPITLMESVAILIYLAQKTGKLMPQDTRGYNEHLQWLLFQVGHLGPMFGQFGHFFKFAKETCKDPYPLNRYTNETKRLLQVLEDRIDQSPYLMGKDYSMVDIASFPWVECLTGFYGGKDHLEMDRYPKVMAWLNRCMARPAFQKAKSVCSRA
ncbi:MAG: glutathione S-transferase N-terminal domain-containing protein [Acidobacteria bacterium]|nr:glutathione S-transferase N-terminal domain-containing protein [Acidobacteriota bacterium]MCB9398669.1 glutathione S-transferase N-terminal domain-containing protein [Acidobacteriota bacterium]